MAAEGGDSVECLGVVANVLVMLELLRFELKVHYTYTCDGEHFDQGVMLLGMYNSMAAVERSYYEYIYTCNVSSAIPILTTYTMLDAYCPTSWENSKSRLRVSRHMHDPTYYRVLQPKRITMRRTGGGRVTDMSRVGSGGVGGGRGAGKCYLDGRTVNNIRSGAVYPWSYVRV